MDLQVIANIALVWLGFMAGVFPSLVLHELGHLVGGRMTGYRLVSFRLLKWLWTKGEAGKRKALGPAALQANA